MYLSPHFHFHLPSLPDGDRRRLNLLGLRNVAVRVRRRSRERTEGEGESAEAIPRRNRIRCLPEVHEFSVKEHLDNYSQPFFSCTVSPSKNSSGNT